MTGSLLPWGKKCPFLWPPLHSTWTSFINVPFGDSDHTPHGPKIFFDKKKISPSYINLFIF